MEISQTSNSTATMIADNLIDRDDNHEHLILMMVMQTIDSSLNNDSEQARPLTAIKIAWMQQSTSLIMKTFVTTVNASIASKKLMQLQQSVDEIDCNNVYKSKQLWWCLQDQTITTINGDEDRQRENKK